MFYLYQGEKTHLIEADDHIHAALQIAAVNKFENGDGLLKFLMKHYEAIVMACEDEEILDKLEAQNGLYYWQQSKIIQSITPEPGVPLHVILAIGVKLGVISDEKLLRFVVKPTWSLKKIEVESTPFNQNPTTLPILLHSIHPQK
jgi:hypothetical protein